MYSCVSGVFPQYNVCEIYPHCYTSVVYNYLLLNNMPLFIHSPFWVQLDALWQMYIPCNHHDKTEHFHYLQKLPCAPFTTQPFSHHGPRHYYSAFYHYSCAFSRTSYKCTYTLCRLACLLLLTMLFLNLSTLLHVISSLLMNECITICLSLN